MHNYSASFAQLATFIAGPGYEAATQHASPSNAFRDAKAIVAFARQTSGAEFLRAAGECLKAIPFMAKTAATLIQHSDVQNAEATIALLRTRNYSFEQMRALIPSHFGPSQLRDVQIEATRADLKNLSRLLSAAQPA